MTPTIPCPHCERRLALRISTDGNGGTVEDVERCQCEGARWRRGECVDCGAFVGPKRRPGTYRKRCRKHEAIEERRRSRKSMARAYRRDPDKYKARARQTQRQKTPKQRQAERKRRRKYYAEELRIRGRKPGRCPVDVRPLRDRLIYRLRYTEGWKVREVAEAVGITISRTFQILAEQRAFRDEQQQRRSA